MEMLQDRHYRKNIPTGHFTHTDAQETPAACAHNSDSCQSEEVEPQIMYTNYGSLFLPPNKTF